MLEIVLVRSVIYGKRKNRETQVKRSVLKYCLRLRRGYSKLTRILLVSLRNDGCVIAVIPHKKMKFSIKDFFSKCDQIPRKLWIWSHLLKQALMENQ